MGIYHTFRREFGLILVGGIIFTASLMWKDFFVEVEEIYFPKKHGISGRLFFTLLITLVLIFAAIYLRDTWDLRDPDPNDIRKKLPRVEDPMMSAHELAMGFNK